MPERLRRLRERLGLSQVELAHELGVSHNALNRWINAHQRPVAKNLERIVQLERQLEESAAGPEGTETTLPHYPTSFLGRRRELDQVHALWATGGRWLTITGPGGVGKTRLAVELLRPAGDSVTLVRLDDVEDPALVAARIIRALGGRPGQERGGPDAVATMVAGRSGVVLLDTCERVASAVAAIAERVLAKVGGMRFIATSQAVLHVTGEQVYRLAPLDIADSSAFFLTRAREADPKFEPAAADDSDVQEICRRLDGMPNALELAAAWTPYASPADLLAQLDLNALKGYGSGGRHQSLAQGVDWSASLLSPRQRTTISRLSVFAGPFMLEEIEALDHSPDIMSTVRELVDLSWLMRVHQPVAHYRILDSLRQWGRGQLDVAPGTDQPLRTLTRHLVEVAHRAEIDRFSPARQWPIRLDLLRGSLDEAINWSLHHEPALASALVTSLIGWWRRSGGLADGQHWCGLLLEQDLSPLDGARVACVQALIAIDIGDYDAVATLSTSALTVLDADTDPVWRARALTAASSAAKYRNDPASARHLLEEAAGILTDGPDPYELAVSYNNLGAFTAELHDLTAAEMNYQKSLAIKQRLNDRRAVALTLANLGDVYSQAHRPGDADDVLAEGLQVAHQIGDQFLATFIEINIGENLHRMGRFADAETIFTQARTSADQLQIPRFQALAASGQGQALLALGRPDQARRALRTAHDIATRIDDQIVLDQVERAQALAATGPAAHVAVEPRPEAAQLLSGLSPRERDVLHALVDGGNNEAIAKRLYLSPKTVRDHLSAIYTKLDVRNRNEATAAAARAGLRPR